MYTFFLFIGWRHGAVARCEEEERRAGERAARKWQQGVTRRQGIPCYFTLVSILLWQIELALIDLRTIERRQRVARVVAQQESRDHRAHIGQPQEQQVFVQAEQARRHAAQDRRLQSQEHSHANIRRK